MTEQEPGKELEISELNRLLRQQVEKAGPGLRRELAKAPPRDVASQRLPSQVALRSLARLARIEQQDRDWTSLRGMREPWASTEALFGLIVVLHQPRGSAYAAARAIEHADRVVRRSGPLLTSLLTGQPLETWPYPMRPERGGLEVVYAQAGSVDLILQAYGELAEIAQSKPAALASLTALAWQLTGYARQRVSHWRVRAVQPEELAEPPVLSKEVLAGGDVRLQVRNSAEWMPVLERAVELGSGLSIEASEEGVRIVVLPRFNPHQ